MLQWAECSMAYWLLLKFNIWISSLARLGLALGPLDSSCPQIFMYKLIKAAIMEGIPVPKHLFLKLNLQFGL